MKNKLMEFIMSNVMNKYMLKYRTKYSYPIIMGGVNMDNCVPNNKMEVSDIDIAFVVKKKSAFKIAEANRDSLIQDIINDADLQTFMKGKKLVEYKLYEKRPKFNISQAKVVRLKYNGEVIIDTAIYSKFNNKILGYYQKIFPKTKNYIPYYINDGIIYATCNYVLYDIVRLILWYKNKVYQYPYTQKFKDKYDKYVLKFKLFKKLKVHEDIDFNPDFIIIVNNLKKYIIPEEDVIYYAL